MKDVSALFVLEHESVAALIRRIDAHGKGLALVVGEDRRLLATVTDGDVRRAILAGVKLDAPVRELLAHRNAPFPTPITVHRGTSHVEILNIMTEFRIRHVPVVDEDNRVVDLVLQDDFVESIKPLPLHAVIMAGGYGRRLRPLSERIPKPMVPIRGRPLLELIIERLKRSGIRRVTLATHYLSDVISEYFQDGSRFGIRVQYVQEERPLGTAGALRHLDHRAEPLLVINSDILTEVDFRALHAFHGEHEADMTVAVWQQEVHGSFGVVDLDGTRILGIREKPVIRQFVNAGIYLLEPAVLEYVPDRPCDMPELIARLIKDKRPVVGFPVHEYWLDIGQMEDYRRALVDAERGALKA